MTTDIQQIRRENLRTLAAQWGGNVGLAKRLKYEAPSYVSQLTNGHRPITEKTARRVEKVLELSTGFMDTPHNSPATPATVDVALVIQIDKMVSGALKAGGIKASSRAQERLVALAYEQAARSGGIDAAYVNKLVELLK